jgi:hypothetical protein
MSVHLCFPVCAKVSLYVTCLLLSVSGFPVLVPVFLSVPEYFLYHVSCFVTLCQWFPCPCPFLPVCSKVSLYVSCLCCRLFSCLCPCLLSVPTSSYICTSIYILFVILCRCFSCLSFPVSLFLPLCPSVFLSLYLFLSFPLCRVFPANVFNCLPDCPICPSPVFHV